VDLRILGPVEAYDDEGRRLDLGPRRARFVLGLLALHAGRSVAVDRLIDLTWPDGPPRTAEHALHVLVSQLRAGVPVARRGRGYQLGVEPEAVDLHRFRTLAAAARAETGADRAVELSQQALALWRGEPMADCAPGDSTTAGLHEEHLRASEDHADALVRAARYSDAVSALTDLTARHPLRERLTALLMTALHGDGRTAEALAVHRAARDRMADELGLEPGPELAATHTMILRAEAPAPAGLRVVVVDDHPLFRTGLRAALETGTEITVVGEAGDAEEAVAVVAATSPDVVVLDLHLPGASGVEIAARLHVPVLMMTMSGAEEDIVAALRAGARGYMLKAAGRTELLHAVRTVAAGGAAFGTGVAEKVALLAAR
jgi:DNA-binding SARP family transcriptional activator